jgi:beta-phosphoglucomutase-like phosphatase (HAD superfamily)
MKYGKLFIALLILAHCIFLQSAELEHPELNPRTTIIAWDVDGVLLKDRTKENKKWLAEHPQFMQAMDTVKKKHKLSDTIDIIDAVGKENPELAKLAQEFKDLSTKAPRIEGITEALTQLQKAGYLFIVASNMTTKMYQALLANNTLPQDFFSKDFFYIKNHTFNQKPDGSFAGKPDPFYFENLKKYVNQKYPNKFTTFILVDDKEENTAGAQKAGFKTVFFKNPTKMLEELKQLGININYSK